MSLAVDGGIERDLEAAQLQERLAALLGTRGAPPPRGGALLEGMRRLTARSKA